MISPVSHQQLLHGFTIAEVYDYGLVSTLYYYSTIVLNNSDYFKSIQYNEDAIVIIIHNRAAGGSRSDKNRLNVLNGRMLTCESNLAPGHIRSEY